MTRPAKPAQAPSEGATLVARAAMMGVCTHEERVAIVAIAIDDFAATALPVIEAARRHVRSFEPGTLSGSELNLACELRDMDGDIWEPWCVPGELVSPMTDALLNQPSTDWVMVPRAERMASAELAIAASEFVEGVQPKERPTIEELEAILAQPDGKVRVAPSGEVYVRPTLDRLEGALAAYHATLTADAAPNPPSFATALLNPSEEVREAMRLAVRGGDPKLCSYAGQADYCPYIHAVSRPCYCEGLALTVLRAAAMKITGRE